jgi:ferric-dicitrate binding protein FerR (iron transport regulator)
MTEMEHSALAHIERTLADAYRKEIEQEENVWRSLPFFAAPLALELAALFQVIDKVPEPGTWSGWVSVALLAAAGVLMIVSLGFLAASIYPARFDYVAREPALLNYAKELIRDEQTPENQSQEDPFSAVATLKSELARQYALAADHNRQINKRRERWRSIAGLAALGSVLTTVFLMAATYAHYLSVRVEKDLPHVAPAAFTPALPGG